MLVFFKWPFIGFLVEIFGFLNLFGYVLEPSLTSGTHKLFSLQRFLPGNLDVLATTSVHWDVLDASLRPRRV